MPSVKNLVFFGSSPFSTIVLQKLIDQGYPPIAVVTSPDQPAGRHLKLTPNPVKLQALKNTIPTSHTPIPGDIALVAAYGQILKLQTLALYSNRIYNIHPSLLPAYRGPSPLQQQILDAVTQTGVTLIQMDEQVDHGPIVAQETAVILPTDTTITLGTRLFSQGTDVFLKLLANSSLPFPSLSQREGPGVSYTHKLTRASGFLPWPKFLPLIHNHLSPDIDRLYRAYHPWPGVWTLDPNQRRLKLLEIHPIKIQTT